ncbi:MULTISPECIES: lipoprotein [Acinetobacter]|uniref:lipoprotein n=1 Tax=Acinetobacter TaxID=469 RepID=UPI00141BDD9F|nr:MULTISPECIES: lipoprotein [Acinetobacter]MCS4297511.1 TolA-binding protein [Acinetobacter guillouiae]MCW2249808.1 TolA-binding protein [Acinetobacter sp. BIGb0204]NII38912.1 TolA-binding protein [Acinetobacter sp. BIGb0196]
MKKFTYIISLALLLTGCNEANYAKLSYQAQSCTADNSVSCNDIRVRRAIVATEMGYQQMVDEKDKAMAEIGQTSYNQLLDLIKQKIEHLKKQRPSLYLRWFQGDSRYYKDVNFGDQIDAKIEKLINAKNAAPSSSTSAELIQDGEPIHVASEQNQTEQFSEKYQHSYTFTVIEPVLARDYDLLLSTKTGVVKFDLQYTSVAQNFILEKLKKGDCVHFSAKEMPVMNAEHQLYFETYITDPQIVQCD